MFIMKKEDLIKLNACADGINMFDKFAKLNGNDTELAYPEGWTPLHTVYFYEIHARIAFWAEENNLIPTYELSDFPDLGARKMIERLRNAQRKTK